MSTDKLKLAQEFLQMARQELDIYKTSGKEVHLREACEKAWAAIAQALMHAAGRPITTHSEFDRVAQRLSETYRRSEIFAGYKRGEQLHGAGFYHGALDLRIVKHAFRDIEGALQVIQNCAKQPT